jgi:O-antigen/teichoic acid export membrane protein
MLPDVLAGEVREIQLVVTTLGLAFVVQLLVGPARGILSGHHRWKTNNVINAACDLGGAAGMIGVLLAGGELHHVALAFLLATVVAEMFRFAFAAKQINDIRVRLVDFHWNRSKELVRFGIKTSVMVLPMLFALQTTNIILAGAAGAAALAIFARPLALVSQVNALVNKFSLVLTPMASSLVGLGDSHRIQKIFIHSLRISCILSGFMLSVLFVFGDWIIGLWMGQDFVNKEVISILALGMYLPVAMSAALQILAGLNAHGRASLLALGVTVIVYGSMYSFAVMGSGFDQTTAALTLSAALTAGLGMAVPIYASRKIGISFPDLILKSVLAPTVPIIVACMMMQLIRYSLPLSEVMAFGSGVIVGASIVGLSWWYFLSSKALRQRLAGFLRPNAGKLEV